MDALNKSGTIILAMSDFFDSAPAVAHILTTVFRWGFVAIAIFVLLRSILSLLRSENPSEIWAYVQDGNGTTVPISHWENVIGRMSNCDIVLDDMSVSRNHSTLIRNKDGSFTYTDLGSRNGSKINGRPVLRGGHIVDAGDVISIGTSDLTVLPVSLEEQRNNTSYRMEKSNPMSPWSSVAALTLFQLFTALQLIISMGDECPSVLPLSMIGLCAVMWAYFLFMRSLQRLSFEMETIAFFLSTLSLAVAASASPDAVLKQLITILIGVGLFVALCWFLRDIKRATSIRIFMVAGAVLLLLVNIAFGTSEYGAQNWISLGSFTIQPSEFVKIAFVCAGAATLNELFTKKNLSLFIGLSIFCLGALAVMSDFGTAAVFFVAFLVISFLRSGDFSKLILIIAVALTGVFLMLRFKPYIADRFSAWGHVWEYADSSGFQQTRTMTASASGGLVGMGAGNGWLKNIFAADTDLVFGMLTEEWGLIISCLAVLSIVTLSVFAVRSIMAGRSTFYTIAACSAMTMLLTQTILNVFGSVDILPLTGVTFPFVSNGGSSMIVSWGLLAFLKAADTRQNASFAVRLSRKSEFMTEEQVENLKVYEPVEPEVTEVKDFDDLF